MVVVHLVFFSFKVDASEVQIEALMSELRALGALPGVISLTCGKTFTTRGKQWTHALTVHFTDKAALDAYAPHPAHQKVLNEFVKPILEEVIAIDYEA